MAKIQIKFEKLTPFGGIFSIMEQFDALLAQTILLDKVRGFCVCNVSVMQGICTIKSFLSFYKQNPMKPNRLRILE